MATVTALADRRAARRSGGKPSRSQRYQLDPEELPSSVDAFSKNDYALVGVLIAGGARQWVDAEDVAVVCYKLNRPAFRWSRYDYPHLQIVMKALWDLKIASPALAVSPSQKSTERHLTAVGMRRAIRLGEMLVGRSFKDPAALVKALRRKISEVDATGGEITQPPQPKDGVPRREARAILTFITTHPAYRAWTKGKLADVPLWQLADVLQCLPDSPRAVWQERLARHQSLAAWWKREKAQEFLAALHARITELLEV
jgi:hypothetical protein